jgi:hypothetical protein
MNGKQKRVVHENNRALTLAALPRANRFISHTFNSLDFPESIASALALIRRRIPARREPRYTTRLDLSSSLFGSLREKRLELRRNLGAVAVRALNALLFVLTDRHRKGETLATLLATLPLMGGI